MLRKPFFRPIFSPVYLGSNPSSSCCFNITFNSGFYFKKKHSRVKLLDSDEEDEDEEEHNERDQIAHDIFDAEDNEDDAHSNHSLVRSTSRQSTQQYAPIENIGDESDEEVEEIDDFIVDDDDKPIGRPKKKKSKTGAYTDRYKSVLLLYMFMFAVFVLNSLLLPSRGGSECEN